MIHLTFASFSFFLLRLYLSAQSHPFIPGKARADVMIMGTYCIITQTKIKVRNGGERMRGGKSAALAFCTHKDFLMHMHPQFFSANGCTLSKYIPRHPFN